MIGRKWTQQEPFKFGNKLSTPIMPFGGKLNNINKHLNNLHNNMDDKPKQSDL
jgi:hypothetical protein